MSELSADMEGVVARLSEEYANTEIFDSWQPPDGPWTALITGYKERKQQDGSVLWILELRYLTPDESSPDRDREFALVFRENALGFMKSAVKVLAGAKVNDLRESLVVLQGAPGTQVNGHSTTTVKDERTYRNSFLDSVVGKEAV